MDGNHGVDNPFQDDPNSNIPTFGNLDDMDSSQNSSQPGSAGQQRKGKKIVGFSYGNETIDTRERPRSFLGTDAAELPMDASLGHSRHGSSNDTNLIDRSHLPELSLEVTNELRAALGAASSPPPTKPRPVLRRGDSSTTPQNEPADAPSVGHRTPQELRAIQAYERGKRLERREQERSAQASRRSSPVREQRTEGGAVEIPLQTFGPAVETDSEDDALEMAERGRRPAAANDDSPSFESTAHEFEAAKRLVRSHTLRLETGRSGYVTPPAESRSEVTTPTEVLDGYEFIAPRPEKMRGGVLGNLLSLYNNHDKKSPAGSRKSSFGGWDSSQTTPTDSPSGATTPLEKPKRPFFSRGNSSSASIAQLVSSAAVGASPAVSGLGAEVAQRMREKQAADKAARKRKHGSTASLFGLTGASKSKEQQLRITVHIAETIARQRYLEKLCRALMEYGAPTHRLEEYMKMSARVLEIPAQFLYVPGSMIISFDDPQTHTGQVRLVRVNQGLDLGKLRDVHELYKDVVHDRLGVEEATRRLQEITKRKQKFSKWLLILVYGFASASVGPFAFGARLIDLPIAFLLGSLVGLLQLHFATRSELYSNVFEISAAVFTSFLARAFGSIHGGNLFCFSALAQSSIALILPGYTVLCASLELQSRSIVAGSVRMVYAIIYSLFLGFGIMIGTAIYGSIDPNATSSTTCQNPISAPYFFPAVPIFTLCLIVINQGKYKQVPVMMLISFSGYIVNYYSANRFTSNTQIANTLGAFAIGVLANLYSRIGKRCENWFLDLWEDTLLPRLQRVSDRLFPSSSPYLLARRSSDAALEAGSATERRDMSAARSFRNHMQAREKRQRKVGYGLAAAAMLPAIFVQVPSGLAVSGSLVAGLTSANQINADANSTTTDPATGAVIGLNSVAFNVSYSVIQVAIGITVGLFLAAVVVYPSGKRRSGLFSF
ncbi:hypothetical protein CAC42_5746 [Sphaceloma murrayae]|uniref:Threonine/serine exporter-like N-terminal domain-containing protein n=1 Tax=Sphaceloma murrayae TaxID=2082308 RepID=A0A2K1QZ15_9PEZI|nr:hypothetical protein CAC42_5746 [Sphaceloma murrayae]